MELQTPYASNFKEKELFQMKASIFNIQKFSIHDGPGIRTVVFFKGCPLRCKWCSNPESQMPHTQILWNREKCLHCELCETSCPTNSISFENNIFHFKYSRCTGCMACTSQCPGKALEYVGKQMTVEEVMKEVMKDKDFYEESGGGVTLSGGEVLSQPEFATALLKECKKNGLHTALETTGYAPFQTFQAVTGLADLLLFDMKHYDKEKHREYTSASNEQITDNMKTAVSGGKHVIARIPVIPGANDSLEYARGFCGLLHDIGVREVNLLPFHQFGESKYAQLGMSYEMKDVKALHSEDLREFFQVFADSGFDVKM